MAISQEQQRLLKKAKKVLQDNWAGSYTRPSIDLYPHQWNWDSGFIAIGYSHIDQERAQMELLSLYDGQWPSGMLPHIRFNPEFSNYFPGYKMWLTKTLTSGITQPPVQASAVWLVYKNAKDKTKAKKFLQEIFPKILNAHDYLYSNRDPEKEGLVYIIHPWESGLDNLPIWDEVLGRIPDEKKDAIERRDLDNIPKEERPSDVDYARYLYLVDQFIDCNYDDRCIYDKSSFLVQDVLFNSILHKSNKDLIEIAKIIGKDYKKISGWIKKTKKGFNEKLINRKNGIYHDFDLVKKRHLKVDTASGFVPLYAGIPTPDDAALLYAHLNSNCFCELTDECLALPNYNRHAADFDKRNYWRGPIWININWMLYKGLRDYGYNEYAQKIKRSIIHLVASHGFYEYFDPVEDSGYGSKNFSWTAALCIDLIKTAES